MGAFDLNKQADLAAGKCSSTQQLTSLRQQLIDDLGARSVRLFMCDSALDAQLHLPIAYAAHVALPSTTIDQYLDRLPQAPGRQVVDRHHTPTNAGDMVVQKISQTVTRVDGAYTTQSNYSFLSSGSTLCMCSSWSFRASSAIRMPKMLSASVRPSRLCAKSVAA